jgi:diguanylate cyclase (GGDEF)-like protein
MRVLSRNWSTLSSSVGRRTLVAFVIATLIPATAIALLALHMHQKNTVEHVSTRIAEGSEALGLALLDELNTSTILLESVATSFEKTGTLNVSDSRPVFDEFAIKAMPGREHHDAKPIVLLENTADPDVTRIALAIPIQAGADTTDSFLVGWIAPGFLWGAANLFSDDNTVCVMQANGVLLFCPDTEDRLRIGSLINRMNESTSGYIPWADDQGELITGYSQLFLSSKYDSEPWIVARTTRPKITALWDTLPDFAYLPMVLLLILSPLLVAMIQIRQTMEPIDGLIAGVGRIAKRDYSNPIAEKGPTEFVRLANSINSMSEQIRTQITTLNSFSEIDRVLLAEKDIGTICQSLIRLLTSQSQLTRATILLIGDPEADKATIFRNHEGTTIIDKSVMRLSRENLEMLEEIGHSDSVDVNQLTSVFLDALDVNGNTLEFPIVSRNELRALLLVSTTTPKAQLESYALELVRGCHERLTLAANTVDRDKRLKFHASHDELTELANKRLLGTHIEESVRVSADHDAGGALLYIDLDAFKSVNDISGHAAGDRVLGIAGTRLQKVLGDDATVARIGGDEFAVLIPQVDDAESASETAEEIIHALNRPILFSGVEHQLGASIGIALIPKDGDNLDELLFRADLAMYEAKRAGRNTWKYYRSSMKKAVQARASFEKDLRRAVEHEDFTLRIQPQIDIRTGRIIGGEALLRWTHEDRGPITPMEFIPLAEETGLIVPLGEWVMLESARLFSRWRRSNLDIEKIAVNVSLKQFLHKNFKSVVESAIAVAGEPAHGLEIEITESLFASDARRVVEICEWLQTRGVSVAIDDFGTGYSSLSYLNALPFETLKIDRSFIDKIGRAENDTSVVDMIIELARHLDRKVVAEGVTSMAQLRHLREKDCELAQGFLIAKPMLPEDFAKSLGQTPFHSSQESLTAVLKVVDLPLAKA